MTSDKNNTEVRIISVMAWVLYPRMLQNLEPFIREELLKEMVKIERILYLSCCGKVPRETLLQMASSRLNGLALVVDNTKRPLYEREEYRMLCFLSDTAFKWLSNSNRLDSNTFNKLRNPLSNIKTILDYALNKDKTLVDADKTTACGVWQMVGELEGAINE